MVRTHPAAGGDVKHIPGKSPPYTSVGGGVNITAVQSMGPTDTIPHGSVGGVLVDIYLKKKLFYLHCILKIGPKLTRN